MISDIVIDIVIDIYTLFALFPKYGSQQILNSPYIYIYINTPTLPFLYFGSRT
jgi:hypothetical protein